VARSDERPRAQKRAELRKTAHLRTLRAPAGFRLRVRAGATIDWLADCLRADLDRGRGFLWLPVAFALGIALYFTLPREPHWPTLVGFALATTLAAARARRMVVAFPLLVFAASLLAGLAAAAGQTARVAAPVLSGERTLQVVGWIEAREPRPDGAVRYILRVHAIERLAPARTPKRVRFTARGRGPPPRVGDGVSVLARLAPPRGPVQPGGYDGARSLFFEGIGATGFSFGMPKPADLGDAPGRVRVKAAIARVRDGIAKRLRQTLPGENGELAATLLVGDRGGIPKNTQEAIRASGLGHILAISGLHMALVAGTVFGAVRFGLAALPAVALRHPIKKWAAVAALLAGFVYLVLSGGAVATIRAFVMAAVAFLAVLVDRPALTLRSVALAALIVMALDPSAVLGPGFQMSFAAVIALVAAYEALAHRERRPQLPPNEAGRAHRLARFAAVWIGGLALTSFIAGLATGPIGAFHFHRVAPLGLLGNLLAMPFVSLIVMPMGVVSVALMPLGLDPATLPVMGLGLDAVVTVADRVARWSGNAGAVGRIPVAAILLMTAGLLWLALWQARWRLAGLAVIAAGLVLVPAVRVPDLLISDDGRAVAARGADGRLRIATAQGGTFAAAMWLRADGDEREPDAAGTGREVGCDAYGCILEAVGLGPAEASPQGRDDPRAATSGEGPGSNPGGVAPDGVGGAASSRIADRASVSTGSHRATGPPPAPGAVRKHAAGPPARPPPLVAFVEDPGAFLEDCRRATILVTRHAAPPNCHSPRLVVDRAMLRETGAVALYWTVAPPGYRLTRARPKVARPWNATPVVRR